MNLARLLILVFLQSAATAAAEHAIYFYTKEVHQFSVTLNLLLALVFGAAYIFGAIGSHGLSKRIGGERRALMSVILGQVIVGAVLTFSTSAALFWCLWPMLGWLAGSQWPIIESYVVAGRPPKAATHAIGRFNVTWSIAVVLAVALAGYLIEQWDQALFAMSASLSLLSAILCLATFPANAAHLDDDHPGRLPCETIKRYKPLVVSARWSMLTSYSLMFVIGPYLPDIFKALGFGLTAATLLASILYGMRVVSFAFMERWHGWHGRADILALGAIALPTAALLTLSGRSAGIVIVGEVLFGFTAGVIYTASLYYSMILKDASIEGGGDHEGIIGTGFCLGPILGMAGTKLATRFGTLTGLTLGLSPVLAIGLIGGLWPLWKQQSAD